MSVESPDLAAAMRLLDEAKAAGFMFPAVRDHRSKSHTRDVWRMLPRVWGVSRVVRLA